MWGASQGYPITTRPGLTRLNEVRRYIHAFAYFRGREDMILVTGGAGFIGTHACAALADAGIPTLLLDNFSNNG